MRFLRKSALPFWVLFPAVLAITLTLLALIGINDSTPEREIYLRVAAAVIIAVVATFFLLISYRVLIVGFRKVGKRTLAWITIQTVRKAIISYSITVSSSGVARMEGTVVVGLESGSGAGIKIGDQFIVTNSISREQLGVLEVASLDKDSGLCTVVDFTNPEFWDALEIRADYDPSPPTGVTITRDAREDDLFQWLRHLLLTWRG